MKLSSLQKIRCPGCQSKLIPSASDSILQNEPEIISGELLCNSCKKRFPILAGVALLVLDIEDYLMDHCIGISSAVPVSEIPKAYRKNFSELLKESKEHPEWYEDGIESERVNQIYFKNHFYDVKEIQKSDPELKDPFLISILKSKSVLNQIVDYEAIQCASKGAIIELGSSVGGTAYRFLKNYSHEIQSYIGIDLAFRSVLWSRALLLGASPGKESILPGLSSPIDNAFQKNKSSKADFIVSDFHVPAVIHHDFDLSLALNVIDLYEHPKLLPKLQKQLLKPQGLSAQCSPYVWSPNIQELQLASGFTNPEHWIKKLYEETGFIEKHSESYLPWVFYKGPRQIEVYSVHASLMALLE